MRETPIRTTISQTRTGYADQDSPSALLFEWIAHIKISLEAVCEISPRVWKMLNPMLS
jgi:hypothetical protein